MVGVGGGQAAQTQTSGLSGSHFATVCLHTHLSASGGREMKDTARVRDGGLL